MNGSQLLWHALDDIADHQWPYGYYSHPFQLLEPPAEVLTTLSSLHLLGVVLALIIGAIPDSSALPSAHPTRTCLPLNSLDWHAAATRYCR